jgi:hypothetical protein
VLMFAGRPPLARWNRADAAFWGTLCEHGLFVPGGRAIEGGTRVTGWPMACRPVTCRGTLTMPRP